MTNTFSAGSCPPPSPLASPKSEGLPRLRKHPVYSQGPTWVPRLTCLPLDHAYFQLFLQHVWSHHMIEVVVVMYPYETLWNRHIPEEYTLLIFIASSLPNCHL